MRPFWIVPALAAALLLPLAARANADDKSRFLREQHFSQMRSFKMELDTKTPQRSTQRFFTYVAPDKLRIDIPGSEVAVVVIGNFVWARGNDHKWHKESLGSQFTFLKDVQDPHAIDKRLAGMIVTYAGNATLRGEATHLYHLDAPPKKGFSAKTESIWIGARDGYPRKIVQSNGPYSETATYSSLNAPLSVSGP